MSDPELIRRCRLRDELGWLIEDGASPPRYWNGHYVDERGFTGQQDEAVRFARFQDAETVRCWLVERGSYCKSVQHGWTVLPDPPAVPAAPEPETHT